MDVKWGGLNEETITERDAEGGDPVDLVPGVAGLLAAGTVNEIE